MLPSPDILNDFEHGKFVLSNLAAKRAKQLREGAPPLVRIESNHPLTIALAEIAAGKIKPIMPELTAPEHVDDTARVLVDDTLPSELGLLLPALDEHEVVMVVDEDHDIEAEHEEEDVLSLSDLVGDDEDEEVAVEASEEDTLSLSDIAEQETSIEDEETEE